MLRKIALLSLFCIISAYSMVPQELSLMEAKTIIDNVNRLISELQSSFPPESGSARLQRYATDANFAQIYDNYEIAQHVLATVTSLQRRRMLNHPEIQMLINQLNNQYQATQNQIYLRLTRALSTRALSHTSSTIYRE